MHVHIRSCSKSSGRGTSCEQKRDKNRTKQQRGRLAPSRVGGVAFFAAFALTDGPPHVVQSDSGHQQGDGKVAPVPFSG